MNTIKFRALSVAALSALVTSTAFSQANDPGAPTLPLRYESAFTDYQPQQETSLLPWKDLFTASGDFADTNIKVAASDSPARKVNPEIKVDTPASQPAQTSAPNNTSDTRGRIESINTAENKVKFKHGPIPKFDMPGMTMVFRVQDPKLLTRIKVGDEVGVTLEKVGSGIVITGFQMGEAAVDKTKINAIPSTSGAKPSSAVLKTEVDAASLASVSKSDRAPAAASDTRGRIESINATEGKVKFKHGPIPKFDMPGMTMVFRVQDPKLLTQIKVGDEVGATLDKSGSGFVITGFQK